MIKTLMYHKVKDFTIWKAGFDGFLDTRKAAGEVDYSVGTVNGEPNTAYVLNSWKSLEAFQAFVSSPELKAGMEQAGVLEPPTTIILSELNKG